MSTYARENRFPREPVINVDSIDISFWVEQDHNSARAAYENSRSNSETATLADSQRSDMAMSCVSAEDATRNPASVQNSSVTTTSLKQWDVQFSGERSRAAQDKMQQANLDQRDSLDLTRDMPKKPAPIRGEAAPIAKQHLF
eukprot:CAMPEP_0185856682 /NCGR_PEP_ID=MMETSP1354-20130828/29124_1 /TAXON_ID=708628 /ORGANISM="Erythrolobus madagascarensis, Strain CCMP3276" /LENGTH=141 /DNA_ID=CAMNT_0028558943 /DNA_START=46 /DNA_END=471 /DNA_ORIENTATION=+